MKKVHTSKFQFCVGLHPPHVALPAAALVADLEKRNQGWHDIPGFIWHELELDAALITSCGAVCLAQDFLAPRSLLLGALLLPSAFNNSFIKETPSNHIGISNMVRGTPLN